MSPRAASPAPWRPRVLARRQRGAVAVEFALLLLPLSMLLMGIIDWSFALFTDIQVTNAARVGARAASVGDDGESTVRQYLARSGLEAAADVSVATLGDEVDVQIAYPFSPLVGLVPTPNTINARAVMRLEGAP